MEIKISFPGGKRVDAHFGHHVIQTDQPRQAGGDDSAAAPFDLFLASIGTCAGIYVLGFCQQRNIDTTGLSMTQTLDYNRETRLVETINLRIQLPEHFPDKYKSAILKTANLCTVKRHLASPPDITVSIQE